MSRPLSRQKKYRIIGKILFILYIIFLVYFLIFSERYGRQPDGEVYRYNLLPFKEISRFWTYRYQIGISATLANLAGNVLIFAPFGFFLPLASKFRSLSTTVFSSFILSLCVEMVQFITHVGSFDIDDLILNTLGGLIGYWIYTKFYKASLKRRSENSHHE